MKRLSLTYSGSFPNYEPVKRMLEGIGLAFKKINQDIVVPRGQVEALFAMAARLRKQHSIAVACFGHAGDGNIHVNLMLDESQPDFMKRCNAAQDDLFRGVLKLGGTITGEHGIGLAKKPWWPLAASTETRSVHSLGKARVGSKGDFEPGKVCLT